MEVKVLYNNDVKLIHIQHCNAFFLIEFVTISQEKKPKKTDLKEENGWNT